MNDTVHDTAASKQKLVNDLQRVITDAEELLHATAGQTESKVVEMRERIREIAGELIATAALRALRAGDVAEVYADPSLAQRTLGWRAELGVEAMCRDAWRWQSQNPQGYPVA